jgi:hypothetical protein
MLSEIPAPPKPSSAAKDNWPVLLLYNRYFPTSFTETSSITPFLRIKIVRNTRTDFVKNTDGLEKRVP